MLPLDILTKVEYELSDDRVARVQRLLLSAILDAAYKTSDFEIRIRYQMPYDFYNVRSAESLLLL